MTHGVPPAEHCWVVSDGKTGMETQCLGLAEALGLTPEIKRIRTRAPWRWLPPGLWRAPLRAIDPALGDRLDPPWPEWVIASGRQTVAPALAIRRACAGRTLVVQIQNPTVDPARFDVVIAPEHDRIAGDNVIITKGALSRVTQSRLEAAARAYAARVAHLPRPYVAVLVGGTNKAYRLPREVTEQLAARLVAAARACGGSLLITPSRRTGRGNEEILRAALAHVPGEFWDRAGENPYFAYLGLADSVVVTCDSVNMVSEAASTGKPVQLAMLPGGSDKFRRFLESMHQAGITRPFTDRFEAWTYRPLRETERAAAQIRARLGHGRAA